MLLLLALALAGLLQTHAMGEIAVRRDEHECGGGLARGHVRCSLCYGVVGALAVARTADLDSNVLRKEAGRLVKRVMWGGMEDQSAGLM